MFWVLGRLGGGMVSGCCRRNSVFGIGVVLVLGVD